MSEYIHPANAPHLVAHWDFGSGGADQDSATTNDGQNQSGTLEDGATASGGQLSLKGDFDRFEVTGDFGGVKDSALDLDQGTFQISFNQAAHVGTSADAVAVRGEFSTAETDGWMGLQVTAKGAVELGHIVGGGSIVQLATQDGFFSPGDDLRVTYSWDVKSGVKLHVENLT